MPARVSLGDLAVVVDEAEQAVAHGHPDHDPDEAVVEVRPEQHRDEQREQDQQPAHRRRAGLALVVGADLADRLPHAQARQLPDQRRAHQEGDEERRERRRPGAEGDVAEDVEGADIGGQRVEQVVEHSGSRLRFEVASATRSILIARDPLTSTQSPRSTSSRTGAPASSLVRGRRGSAPGSCPPRRPRRPRARPARPPRPGTSMPRVAARRPASRCAPLRVVAELAHVAQHGDAPAALAAARQQPQGHLHRLRVGVVAVVDQHEVAGQLAPLEAARDRAVEGEALRHLVERSARRQRGGAAASAFSTVVSPSPATAIAATPCGARSSKAKPPARRSATSPRRARRPRPRARSSAPAPWCARRAPRRGVVGVQHGGALRRQRREQIALLAGRSRRGCRGTRCARSRRW